MPTIDDYRNKYPSLKALDDSALIDRVAEAAGHVGFASGQIQLHHAGSLRRRVWCTHCHAFTDGVTTNVVPCAGCGRHLLVRDHFSRRLGAFMGVMVDAEAPGEIPAIEEVFA